jgi:hypothetical protein
MPGFEGPFTAEDVCRIWLNNLGVREQADVVCWFYNLAPTFFTLNQPLPTGLTRTVIETIVGILPLGGTAVKIVNVVEGLSPTVQSR